MSSNHLAAYQAFVWLFLVEGIGSGLRERYRPPTELPPAWLTMLSRLYEKLEGQYRIKGAFEILT
jgi:hypothetical protein